MKIALAGNPNVGKSVLFSRITGIGVISSNYPGTTVQFEEGVVVKDGQCIQVFDLPGTYSLAGVTEDEVVATEMLVEGKPDFVVAVVDATRLEQSLVLVLQLIELGFRVVVALNFMDQARKRFSINVDGLSAILQVPVVPTVATTGEGVDRLIGIILSGKVKPSEYRVKYDGHIESLLEEFTRDQDKGPSEFPLRGSILKLLEGNEFFTQQFSDVIRAQVHDFKEDFERIHRENLEVHIARNRYGEAGRIASQVIGRLSRQRTWVDRISELTLRPATGIPILMVVLIGVFLSIVVIGGLLESILTSLYLSTVGEIFDSLALMIGGTFGQAVIQGINLSFQAIIAIVIPYIIVFYLILGVLEDSGYLPRVVMLLDGIMLKLGLHGRAIIPMVVGTGCNVPAILATRVMESKRERLILATITVMAVPCSAQTVIIIGTVGKYGGIWYAALIYLILLALILILGRLLHRIMRMEPSGLAIEIPDLSVPSAANVLRKTYSRTKDFFLVAFPLLLAGSIILELLMSYNVLGALVQPLAPFTLGFLGLPPVVIIALIFGILRKEMALQILFVLFSITAAEGLSAVLTPEQLFVFALVMATYLPCFAVFAVMIREFGMRDTLIVALSSIILALALGGTAHFLFSLF